MSVAAQGSRKSRDLARWMPVVLATIVTLIIAHSVGSQVMSPPVDSYWYREMADGHNVIQPFAGRILVPYLAHALASMLHVSNDGGFYLVGIVSLWVTLLIILRPVTRHRQASGYCAALCLVPFWPDLFRSYFLPDIFFTALLAVFLWLLRERIWLLSAMMLIPLYLTRESTMLLCLITVPVMWYLEGALVGILFSISSLVSFAASKWASHKALPNIHHLDPILYMLGKIPWNFSKNILGITLWTNDDYNQKVPSRLWQLPSSWHIGSIHQIGWYSPSLTYPLISLRSMLLVFGLGPCAFCCLYCRANIRKLFPTHDPHIVIAAIYGTSAYVIAPCLGASVYRLLGYGWPVFLMYLPAVMPGVWPRWRSRHGLGLIIAHVLPGWLVWSGMVQPTVQAILLLMAGNALGLTLFLVQPTHLDVYQ